MRRKRDRSPVSALPPGTEIIHNPTSEDLNDEVGFSEESELLERHGKHFHLIEGDKRIAIEVTLFVERREQGRPVLVEDRTAYVLPEGTSLMEARRLGYELLDRPHDKSGGGGI